MLARSTNLGQSIIQNLHPEFFYFFSWHTERDSVVMLAAKQQTKAKKNEKVSSIFIHATTSLWVRQHKLHFILACPCMSKHLRMSKA